MTRTVNRPAGALLVVALMLFAACNEQPDANTVTSYLQGSVTTRAEVDSIRDYRGFEVLVASADGLADTLGIAITDSTGSFSMTIVGPERGIYPLLVRRRGALLKQGQIVVADGDSATMNLRIPDGRRPLVIRSKENAAWLAYRNTKAVHNRELLAIVQSGDLTEQSHRDRFALTAELLWNLQSQFPGTIGAEIAAAESILMLDGIRDSMAVERALTLDVDAPGFVDVARAVRRAESRRKGLDAAVGRLESFKEKATSANRKAAFESEIVLALVDSGRVENAIARARNLRSDYGDTEWAGWAKDAIYELENLMPGMPAPEVAGRTWSGDQFDLSSESVGTFLLEFFQPRDNGFLREASIRDSLIQVASANGVTYVSVSVDPDSVINEAFFESRDSARIQLALSGGRDDSFAKAYNVQVLPKRILIHQGRIVAKYTGAGTLPALMRDIAQIGATPPS
ncbi:MAG: alkyl hydroperoxide reductase [Rhodothermia bacterium]|nr:alkyl hydroperoxide reductase [Rhodothermia bacterium]